MTRITVNIPNIPTSLVEIHAKLVEKLGGQPIIEVSMSITQAGKFYIHLYGAKDYEQLYRASSDNPNETIQQALKFVAGMASKDEQRVAQWQKDLAHVIDEGHDLNLPDNVLDPLRSSSQAMTENLLDVTT